MYKHWMKCFKYLDFSTWIHPISRGGGSKRFEKVYISHLFETDMVNKLFSAVIQKHITYYNFKKSSSKFYRSLFSLISAFKRFLNIFSGIKSKFNLGGKTYLDPRAVTKTIQLFSQRLSLLF